ncbi:MAG: DUF6896 domain-containing protein [Aggregatilineales bacterium]
MEALTPDQLAVYTLVKKFVERQRIVFGAIVELRPDRAAAWGMIPVDQLPEHLRVRDKYSIIFRGDWGDNKEWHYFLHGGGCRLIHSTTGEPIEWDAPNVQRFDRHWFANWVKWTLTQRNEEPAIVTIKSQEIASDRLESFLLTILDQLQILGMLIAGEGNYSNKHIIKELAQQDSQ